MEFRLKASMGTWLDGGSRAGIHPQRPAQLSPWHVQQWPGTWGTRCGRAAISRPSRPRSGRGRARDLRPCRQGRRLFLPTPIQATQGIHQAESDLAPYRMPSYVEMEAGASRIRLNAADSAIPVFEDSRAQ